MLDKLKSTSSGPDLIPSWFLKLAACSIAEPLTHLFNLSLSTSIVPQQWKQAIIKPIPKVTQPTTCTDFRPISLTSIPSRILQRFVVKTSLYPLFRNPSLSHLFTDQFAYIPTGSTDAAIISILHHVTNILSSNSYVHLNALDFSKAFDTLKHAPVFTKLAALPIPDNFYNWIADYFKGHSHVTMYNRSTSNSLFINASVFQGSVVGPPIFSLNGSDLKPVCKGNFLDKYADDSYLIVPSSQESTIEEELDSIAKWAATNNLSLNRSKSAEMIIFKNEKTKSATTLGPPLYSIARVEKMKVLGVTFSSTLSFNSHVDSITQTAAQALYAIKLLKSHGLDNKSTKLVCHATVISRITYAVPSWWGFVTTEEKKRLQSIVKRAIKWGFYDPHSHNLEQIVEKRETELFSKILLNPSHVLHHLLPPVKQNSHNLRPNAHNRQLPEKGGALFSKTFIQRLIFKDVY